MIKLDIIRFAAAALLLAACAACSDPSPEQKADEVSLVIGTQAMATKGIVTGETLVDAVTGSRPLYLSAFLHSQDDEDADYFINEPFTADGGSWKAHPALFWPLDSRLDFLGYSSCTPFDDFDVEWGRESAASRLRLRILGGRSQDDILYGSLWNAASAGDAALRMDMFHSQAWIEARVSCDAANEGTITLTSIALKDIYTSGRLIVEANYGAPEASWSFIGYYAATTPVDDLSGIFGRGVTSTPASCSLLIPEQEQTALIVRFIRDGVAEERELPISMGWWQMGKHYIYELNFSRSTLPLSVTVTVTDWQPGTEVNGTI